MVKAISKTEQTIADEDGPIIKPTTSKDMEVGVDKTVPAELDPNFGKSKGDIKKEEIANGSNDRPEDKIGQKWKNTKPVEEKKQELPSCGPNLGPGVPCKKIPICTGNGGVSDPHVSGENCRPAGPRSIHPYQHLPPELETH